MTTDVVIPEQDLPDWMKRAQRGADWGLLLAALLSLIVVWPFIHYETLPRTNDVEAYVFQASDTAEALQEGYFYPRWSPHAQGGYGAPIPNYYPPATSYITGLLNQLVTNNPILAVRLSFILFYVLAGTMIYTLTKHLVNANAGLLATALYLFNPYIVLTVPHIIGDVSAVMIVGMLPTFLWATNRYIATIYPSRLLYVSLSFALLILIEPIYALIGAGLAYLLFLRSPIQYKQIAIFTGGLLIGMGVSAFFWVPALAEQSLVRWVESPVALEPAILDFSSLFRQGQSLDPTSFTHAPQMSLGIALPILSLSALGAILWIKKQALIPFVYLVSGLTLLIIQLVSLPENPILFIPIILCLSIASTSLFQLIRQWRWRKRQLLLTSIALAVVLYFAIPTLTHTRTRFPLADYSPHAQLNHEILGWGVAVLPTDAALPATLPEDAPTPLVEEYSSSALNRLASVVGTGNRIFSEYEGSHRHRYLIEVGGNTSLIFQRAHFPTWEVRLNGERITASIDEETHLVRINLSNFTQGALQIVLGTTAIRTVAWIISLFSIIISVGVMRWWWRDYNEAIFQDDSDLLGNHSTRILFTIITSAIVLLWFYVNTETFNTWRPEPRLSFDGAITLPRETETGINLMGYQRLEQTYSPGNPMHITLFWEAERAITTNYQVQVSIREANTDTVWQQSDLRHPAYYPTSRWNTVGFATDRYILHLPPDIPAGFYTFDVQLFPCGETGCDLENPVMFDGPNGDSLGGRLSVIQPLIIQ